MSISERAGTDGHPEYEVEFREYRLEEVAAHFNRFEREDEKPFEAVAQISEFNQRAYELFARPLVQSMSNDATARTLRTFHPLRFQRWAFSDLNPWLAWLPSAANAVKTNRQPVKPDNPWCAAEAAGSQIISASLDYYRAMRDAGMEAAFFSIYANLFSLYLADHKAPTDKPMQTGAQPRDLPFVKDALASIGEGGYTEAIARAAALLARKGEPLPLSRLVTRKELAEAYADYLPEVPPEQWRRIRGEQEIIVSFEPEQALATLPLLIADKNDRARFVTLLDALMTDQRVQSTSPTQAQRAMLDRIRKLLAAKPARGRAAPALARS
jgi:hypothetical protein